MALRLGLVNVGAVDVARVVRFWAEALGWPAYDGGASAYVGSGGPVGIGVVPVPEPKRAAKNRLHLDLASSSPAHQSELVARLRALGATPADVGQGDVPWTVLGDPEGNEFCVLEPRDTYRDTGPIAAVVVDCVDPRAMARFWSAATDWTVHEVADGQAALRHPEGVGPYLEFLRTPAPSTLPDRLRLALLPHPDADRATELARLGTLGATDLGHGVLADPEGHEFCVLGTGGS
ncbi:VOC family protein [Streptomyces sp. Da 82-17]|uniref:VOC family protein n=1 Tax=Streptomyces sp. Da 82-17 TaxID=3377116 RepID=UPI0038D4AF75